MTERKPWQYKGVTVFPAGINSSGIRWTANMGIGITLRAENKQEMRQLITQHLQKR